MFRSTGGADFCWHLLPSCSRLDQLGVTFGPIARGLAEHSLSAKCSSGSRETGQRDIQRFCVQNPKSKTVKNNHSPVKLFARNFVRHPRMLGSFIPSSRFLIRTVLEQIDFQQAHLIVEYGPGVGTFTRPMLGKMRPDAKLVVLETNPDFVQFLQAHVDDPRLSVIPASAADVQSALEA